MNALFKTEFKHKNYLNSSKTKLGILIKKSAYLDSLLKLCDPMEQVASF